MHGINEIYHCWHNTSLPSLTIKIFSKDERYRYRIFILFFRYMFGYESSLLDLYNYQGLLFNNLGLYIERNNE